MTLLDQFSSNGKTPKIIKDRLLGVKSFLVPKKERNFWTIFPYSRLNIINGTDADREVVKHKAHDFFEAYATVLRDMLENPKLGTLKDMKIAFYYMQEASQIIWPRLAGYDAIVDLIYTLRTPEFMQERDRDFFKSFPEWVQKLIMIFVNSEVKFSKI